MQILSDKDYQNLNKSTKSKRDSTKSEGELRNDRLSMYRYKDVCEKSLVDPNNTVRGVSRR